MGKEVKREVFSLVDALAQAQFRQLDEHRIKLSHFLDRECCSVNTGAECESAFHGSTFDLNWKSSPKVQNQGYKFPVADKYTACSVEEVQRSFDVTDLAPCAALPSSTAHQSQFEGEIHGNRRRAKKTNTMPGPMPKSDSLISELERERKLARKDCTREAYLRAVDTDTFEFGFMPTVVRRAHGTLKPVITQALLDCKPRDGIIAKIVMSSLFTSLSAWLIILNAVFVGVMADWEMKEAVGKFLGESASVPSQMREWSLLLNLFFTVSFTLELFLRMSHLRCHFWLGPEMRWNLLDLACVVAGIMEVAVDEGTLEVNYIRALRLLRMLRTLRVMRSLSVLSRLRLMLLAISDSILSMLWLCVLLIFIMYLFAVIFLNLLTSYVSDAPVGSDIQTVTRFFKSMAMTLLTLSMSITGGLSWWEVEQMFIDVSPLSAVLMVLYVTLMVLVLLNIATGIFVNDSIEVAQGDRDIRATAQIARQRAHMKELRAIFTEIDEDGSGTITRAEFNIAMENNVVRALFSSLGLDVSDAYNIFETLDSNGNEELEIEEFVMGCLSIRGMARAADMEFLKAQMRRTQKRIAYLEHSLKEQVELLRVVASEILDPDGDSEKTVSQSDTVV